MCAILATRRIWCLKTSGIPGTVTDMTETNTAIADMVRGVAAEKRFTQKRIAEALGLSRTSVVERVNGRIPFSALEVLTLSQAMNVPVTRFFPEPATVERAA